jgi:predicted RNase H-like HicB family nuclease
MMNFPVVVHKDSDSAYGVTVPDLQGCFSAGDTLDEALENTKEAIACHIEGLLMDDEFLPIPQAIEKHYQNPDYSDGIWDSVRVDISKISGNSKPIEVILPEKILSQLDRYAKKQGESRSSLLVQATVEYLSVHAQ